MRSENETGGSNVGQTACAANCHALMISILGAFVGWSAVSSPARANLEAGRDHMTGRPFVYPLKISSDRRYIVDQRGRPFLIMGDSPQAMIGNLRVSDAATFIANRKAAGFNSLLVDLLCAKYTGCRDDANDDRRDRAVHHFRRPRHA